MTTTVGTILLMVFMLSQTFLAKAAYTETMNPQGLTSTMKDYGLMDDNGKTDQAAKLQKAIDDVAEKGGGRLIISKGTYGFTEVTLKSNVHLLIEKDAVLKPIKSISSKKSVDIFSIGQDGPVENVSIRGLGGRFTVDLREYTPTEKVRAIGCGDVTNFLISDMDVQDNFTIFSSIILAPPDTNKKGFVGATNGTIRECSTFHANVGYGLVQIHAAKAVLFENLYSLGGVTMRVECGVRPKNPEQIGGVFDLVGKNIKCENGYLALLLGPHSTPCGVVQVDGIEAISCEFAVKFSSGFVSKKPKKNREGPERGTFAQGTSVKNVHAVFGLNAQRTLKHLPYTPVELRKEVVQDRPNSLKGPAVTAIFDQANYKVRVENVTTEGFKYIKPIITEEDAFKDAEIKNELKRYASKIKE